MSCFNLRGFPPARKLWGLLTAKLQSKLHKLTISKGIKKHKKQINNSGNAVFRSSSSSQSRFKRKTYRRYYLRKKTAPVYIDQLFVEPLSVLEHFKVPPEAAAAAKMDIRSSTSGKDTEPVHQLAAASLTGATSSGHRNDETNHSADDMWESLVFASPQMRGINERAEEFIARFRAEMRRQEMLFRRLQ